MHLLGRFHSRLKNYVLAKMSEREPDVIIGERANPYLLRWHLIPRNPFFNIYLHLFLRSDDDRALHDHPWLNASILISGQYIEHTPRGKYLRSEGFIYFRRARAAHRVELFPEITDQIIRREFLDEGKTVRTEYKVKAKSCITLFVTGPRIRNWGFHCPKGWRRHEEYLAGDSRSAANPNAKHSYTGKGCD